MVGRTFGPSLSPAVVATGLGRVRAAGGGGHGASHSYERVRANGPVLVRKRFIKHECAQNNVSLDMDVF